ncbi:MAG TPA: GNAT family N-acetyltransferase [Actinophytocola sp.]|jgi:GNAT superfamily N-acetyltransferase|nr:GNAT family N-acetyltransferase [Actinophytocola sp.]
MPTSEITFRRFGPPTAQTIRDTAQAVYEASYVDRIAAGDPFDSVDKFMYRFDRYARRDGFDHVVAYVDGEPVGQSWGWPLQEADATRGWWVGLVEPPEPGFTDEDGTRTFAFSEIMVDHRYAGQGIAHAMHHELLSTRLEQRATLLVKPDNDRAYATYLHWGWRKVNQLRPGWPDAPLFDVLMLQLPIDVT